MYKKKTLRRMQPVTRRYARNLNSLQGILKRLQHLTQDIARLELDSTALFNQQKYEQAIERETSLDHHMQKYYDEYLNEKEQHDEL